MSNRRFFLKQAGFGLSGLLLLNTPAQAFQVDPEVLVNQRLDGLNQLLQEVLEDPEQFLGLVEAARGAFQAGQLQAISQSLGTIAIFTFVFIQNDRISTVVFEQLKLTLLLVIDSIGLAIPEATVTIGSYVSGEDEEVIGPFLGDPPSVVTVNGPQGTQTFELMETLRIL